MNPPGSWSQLPQTFQDLIQGEGCGPLPSFLGAAGLQNTQEAAVRLAILLSLVVSGSTLLSSSLATSLASLWPLRFYFRRFCPKSRLPEECEVLRATHIQPENKIPLEPQKCLEKRILLECLTRNWFGSFDGLETCQAEIQKYYRILNNNCRFMSVRRIYGTCIRCLKIPKSYLIWDLRISSDSSWISDLEKKRQSCPKASWRSQTLCKTMQIIINHLISKASRCAQENH